MPAKSPEAIKRKKAVLWRKRHKRRKVSARAAWAATLLLVGFLSDVAVAQMLPIRSGKLVEIAKDAVVNSPYGLIDHAPSDHKNIVPVDETLRAQEMGCRVIQKLAFVLGLLLSLAAPILFMFGRYARPEIGLPMYVGGLALILVAGLL